DEEVGQGQAVDTIANQRAGGSGTSRIAIKERLGRGVIDLDFFRTDRRAIVAAQRKADRRQGIEHGKLRSAAVSGRGCRFKRVRHRERVAWGKGFRDALGNRVHNAGGDGGDLRGQRSRRKAPKNYGRRGHLLSARYSGEAESHGVYFLQLMRNL